MSKKTSKDTKFGKMMKIPMKVLTKIRDGLISSMIICDGQMGHENFMGYPAPRSFSVNSSRSSHSDDDLRELIRAASTRKFGNKIELDIGQKKANKRSVGVGGASSMPRSFSVGIGRIDEDKPCDFGHGGVDQVRLKTVSYPRSRSHAVSSKRISVGAY